MITRRTFATTFLFASVIMIAFSAPTQAQAQLFGTSDEIEDGDSVHLVEALDASFSIDAAEYLFERTGVANALDAFILTPAGQSLLGLLYISVLQFGTAASVECEGPINVVADMTAITTCIKDDANFAKDNDLTDIEEVIRLADSQFFNEPRDHHIIDLISDGNPTECDLVDCSDAEAEAAALTARDVSAGLGLHRLVAVAVTDTSDSAYLSTLAFPGAPTNIIPPDNFPSGANVDDGFVVEADTFQEVEAAVLQKLVVTVGSCDDPIPPPELNCVGGEFLPIDSTALLIAGMSANMSLLAPIVLAIAGASYFIVRARMNKE